MNAPIAQPSPDSQVREEQIADINFIKWYSGMAEQKIRNAFERYKREVISHSDQPVVREEEQEGQSKAEINDEKMLLLTQDYIRTKWGIEWLNHEWEAGDVIDALIEFARLFQPQEAKQATLMISCLKFMIDQLAKSCSCEGCSCSHPDTGKKTMQSSDEYYNLNNTEV